MLAWSLLSLVSIPTLAAPSNDVSPSHHLVKRDGSSDAKSELQSTTFNGIEVPPIKALGPDNFEETVKDGYWSAFSSYHFPKPSTER